VIAISAAVVLICYKITDMLKPPKHLRHIPYQNYFGHFVSILKRDSALERAQKFSFNLINSQDSNGLFLVSNLSRFGYPNIHISHSSFREMEDLVGDS
jgi:hypothetical protein